MKGPPRTPTKLKLLRGTLKAGTTAANEVQPAISLPECPSHLGEIAKAEYDRVGKELYTLGLLTKLDKALLAGYAEAYADWVDASGRCVGPNGKDLKVLKTGEKLTYDAAGNIIERSGGNYFENPYYSIKKRSAEQMHKFGTEFGLSPSSRARLSGKAKETENAFEGFLGEKQKRKA